VTTVGQRLIDTRLFASEEVLGGAVRRLHNAYPVLETGIGDTIAEVRCFLTGFDNLRLIGRGGTFTYGWIHNMIREGRRVVSEIMRES